MHKVLFFLFFAFNVCANDGLELGAAVDLLYEQGINKESTATDKMYVRSAEIMLSAPIDHSFNGKLSAAAHEENGETVFEVHEAYLENNQLLPRTNLKVGQFFLGIGRLNRFHQHDWVFTSAPKVHRAFFDEEAIFDLGAEANIILPTENAYSLTLGLTSGHRYGHSHTAGAKPKTPTHYARLSRFFELQGASGIDLGANFLSRTDSNNKRLNIAGLDFIAKLRDFKRITWLIQSELWYKNENDQEFLGNYIYLQYGINDQHSLGYRVDLFKDISKRNALNNKKINNIEYGQTINWTFKNSEFALIRSSISHTFLREEGMTKDRDIKAQLQFIFIMGAHPAHIF